MVLNRYIQIVALSALSTLAYSAHNILDYGAVHNVSDTDIAYVNAKAMA